MILLQAAATPKGLNQDERLPNESDKGKADTFLKFTWQLFRWF